MDHLAQTFGCSVETMPFTYLGLPMGTTRPKMEDLTPLMDRVERHLSGCATWLSYSGRLRMINIAFSPIVTYAMCTIKLPRGVIETLTEYVSNVFGEAILKGKEEGISSLGNCLEAQGQGGSWSDQPLLTK